MIKRMKKSISHFVILFILNRIVITTINFDDEPFLCTIKVCYIPANTMLPSKFTSELLIL